jgi:hypothetical protein
VKNIKSSPTPLSKHEKILNLAQKWGLGTDKILKQPKKCPRLLTKGRRLELKLTWAALEIMPMICHFLVSIKNIKSVPN